MAAAAADAAPRLWCRSQATTNTSGSLKKSKTFCYQETICGGSTPEMRWRRSQNYGINVTLLGWKIIFWATPSNIPHFPQYLHLWLATHLSSLLTITIKTGAKSYRKTIAGSLVDLNCPYYAEYNWCKLSFLKCGDSKGAQSKWFRKFPIGKINGLSKDSTGRYRYT